MNGIVCIDKPRSFTSFDVVAKLRGIAKTRKIGHGGTLDPMATGVLPLFLGGATKACDLLPVQDKRYTATFRLGCETDTLDITGSVLRQRPVTVGAAEVAAVLRAFLGVGEQLPPMYSAVQVDGKRLYDLARQGVEVERKPRHIELYEITLLNADEAAGEYTIDVHCSKGTYVRSLCADVGERLGCGAVLTELRRTASSGFTLADCVTLAEAQRLADAGELAARLLPVEQAFTTLPRLQLDERQARLCQNGVRLDAAEFDYAEPGGLMTAWGPGDLFLGLVYMEDETLKVKRLFKREVSA